MSAWILKNKIKGLLLDITGVLYNCGEDGGHVIEGSLEAISSLRKAQIPFRFVSNETQNTRQELVEKLSRFGYNIQKEEIFCPAPAVCSVLKERNLRPYLLVYPNVLSEFEGIDTSEPTCVVIGDAAENFTFENVNRAFQILFDLKKPVLLAMGRGKYYKHGSHYQIDLGAYVAALEYSSDVKAEILGKPSAQFFLTALKDIDVKPEEAIMIGDDIVHDVGGAQGAGMRGVLVRTGKYRTSDENHPLVKPDAIVDNLNAAVSEILKNINTVGAN